MVSEVDSAADEQQQPKQANDDTGHLDHSLEQVENVSNKDPIIGPHGVPPKAPLSAERQVAELGRAGAARCADFAVLLVRLRE